MTFKSTKESNTTHSKAKKIQVGEWIFDLYKLTIAQGNDELSLEPKSVDLLSYLIENPNRVISKQELMDNVWKTIVSDNTISRSIVRLRHTLNDDPQNPTYIATVPRKGYRLIAPVHVIDKPLDNTSLRTGLFAAGIVILLILILSRTDWADNYDVDITPLPMKLTPLTALIGDEIDPALSSDGKLLAFAHRSSEEQPWQIKINNLDTKETFTITPGIKNAWLPAWSPDSSKLVYQNHSQGYCHISIADVSNLRVPVINQSILDCNVDVGSGNVIWANSDVLYYTEAASENDPFVIFRYHISSKNLNQITSPPNSGRGDYRVQLSPDGKWLGFIRNTVYWAQTELWLHNIETGESKRITSLPLVPKALAWLPDSMHLVVANANKQLQTVNIDTGDITEITSEILPLFHPSTGGGKLVASVGSFHHREIWRAQGSFSSTDNANVTISPFITSTKSDYLPRFNPKSSSVAFISQRSGLPQIWLLDELGQLQQLTKFDQPLHIQSMNWSPNGHQLVIASSNQLIWLDTTKRQVNFGPANLITVAEPVWDWDNERIYFSRKVGLEWQLFSYSTVNQDIIQITQTGGYRSHPSRSENTVFLSKLTQPGLWKYDLDSGIETLIGNALQAQNFNRDWVISPSEQHFFFVNPKDVSNIQRLSLDAVTGLPIDVIKLKQDTIINFDVSNSLDTLLYTRTVLGESDIVILTPSH